MIEHRQIKTTLAKAKALRPVVEKLVTLGKKALACADDVDGRARVVHLRRQAAAFLGSKEAVKTLFDEIATASAERKGGYTRITKLGQRHSDAAPMAFIEWVDAFVPSHGDDDDDE